MPLYEKLGALTELIRRSHSQRGSVAAAFLPCRALRATTRPWPSHSQHVGDDTNTPHVRGEGNKVVVHHFRSQELRSPEIHFQLLTGFVPVPGIEPRVRSWGAQVTRGRARQGFWERGSRAEPSAQQPGQHWGDLRGIFITVPLPEQSQEEQQGH